MGEPPPSGNDSQEPREIPSALRISWGRVFLGVIAGAIIWTVLAVVTMSNSEHMRASRVRGQASLVRLDLLSLRRAVTAYSERHGAPPPTLKSVLSRESELTEVPVDRFHPAGEALRLAVEGDSWMLWSVGPDGDDDGAGVSFDVTNGVLSDGDIVLDSSLGVANRP